MDGPESLANRLRRAASAAGTELVVLVDPASEARSSGAVPVDLDSLDAMRNAFEAVGSAAGIDAVVIAAVPPVSLEPKDLVAGGPDWWDATCERPLRVAGHVAQAAYRHLASSAGSLVFVCPSTGIQGAAGFVPLAAAAEGQRILAKSAARQWAAAGVRVNVLAPPLSYVLEPGHRNGAELHDGLRGRIAMGDAYDVDAAISAVLGMLVSPVGRHLIGTTIALDGGQVTAL